MKKIIKRILVRIVKSGNLQQIFSDIENSKKINNCLSAVTNKGTTFYPEAKVENMQNDLSSITVGEGSHIRAEMIVFPYGGKITVGDNCYIGAGTKIWSGDSISIGNNVLIGHNINIIDFSHKSNSKQRAEAFRSLVTNGHPKEKGNIPSRPIVIEDDVIIYAGSNIVMGVTIGKGSIVSAGSVVLKDVAPFSLVVGNPAKMVWKTT